MQVGLACAYAAMGTDVYRWIVPAELYHPSSSPKVQAPAPKGSTRFVNLHQRVPS
jgi:hypothetical protein